MSANRPLPRTLHPRTKLRTVVLVTTSLLISSLVTESAFAVCPGAGPDLPDCACFVGSGDWPLAAVSGDVIATAKKSRYAKTSCYEQRGQPYWQMQLHNDSPELSEFAALLVSLWVDDFADLFPAQAWCTEAVSFWHREAGVPYVLGYERAAWSPTPYPQCVWDLSRWYAGEEKLAETFLGGRGRWIEGQELDYDNFIPGVNGPCPGAYQAWLTYHPTTGKWTTECTHSQVVDSLTVHRVGGALGPITRIDVHVIEGNASDGTFVDLDGETVSRGRVKDTRSYIDVIDYTKLGDSDIPCDENQWKIYGWGIDLDGGGDSYCDDSKIGTVVTYQMVAYPPPLPPSNSDSTAVNAIVAYATATQGQVIITSNSPLIHPNNAWPTPTMPWMIPPGPHPVDPVFIDIDLLQQHPIPVKGVVIDWVNGFVPSQYEVWWAGNDQQPHIQPVTLNPTIFPPPNVPPLPMPTPFLPQPPYGVRYLRLAFHNPSLIMPYLITGVHLIFDSGGGEEDRGGAFDDGLDVLVGAEEPTVESNGLRIFPNRPNPFDKGTWIDFSSAGSARCELRIFDVTGRLVRSFADLPLSEGRSSVFWDGCDSKGRDLASGVYFVEIRSGDDRATRSITLRK